MQQPTLTRGLIGPARAVLALLVLAAVALSAAPAGAATPPGGSWTRAAHLVPGLGAMRISLTPSGGGSEIVVADAAGYGDATDYRRISPGSYRVDLRPSDGPADAAPLLSTTYVAKAGQATTLAGLGSLDKPRLASLVDDLTPTAAGKARVRVVPAASNAPQVTVVNGDGGTIAADAVFGQPTGYATVPDGTSMVRVKAASGATATSTVTLASGGVYSLLVLDAGGGALQAVALQDAAGMMSMPVGGAQTGFGGTADEAGQAGRSPSVLLSAGVLGALGLVLAVTVLRLVRPAPARRAAAAAGAMTTAASTSAALR